MGLRAWLSDPTVRVNLQRSVFDPRGLMFLAVGIISVSQRSQDRAEWFAIFLICAGVVIPAIDLLQMELDGRLDQIRLAGRPPGAFLMSLLLSTGGPWVLVGLGVIAWSRQAGTVSQTVVETAAILGALLIVIAAGTSVGLRQRSVDPRLAIASLIVIAVVVAMLGDTGIKTLTRLRNQAAPFLLVIEAVAIAWFTSGLVRQITYPPSPASKNEWGVRLPLRPWMLRWPGVFRGARLASNGVVLVLVFAPLIIAGRLIFAPASQSVETVAMYLVPIGIGFITVSLLCREDVVSGRLALIRQASTTPITTALELLIGMWAPFVVVSAVLAMLVASLFWVTQFGLVLGIALLALAAPLPVIEGWSRLWPFTYMLPYVVAFGLARRSWPVILAMAALNWWAVPRRFANPDRPVLAGWNAVAVTAGVCAAAVIVPTPGSPLILGLVLIPVVIAISPLLIGAPTVPSTPSWASPLAIAAVMAAVVMPRDGVAAAASIAASAIAAWIAAFRIIALLPGQPVAQSSVRIVILMSLVIGMVIADSAGYADPQDGSILAAPAIALCALTELVTRAAGWLGRTRFRRVTPRP